MISMTTTVMNRVSAEALISQACADLRSPILVTDLLDSVLAILLWSRWIPSSDGDLIGYFDALRSLGSVKEWEVIQRAISERSGLPMNAVDGVDRVGADSLEHLRADLLPIARALNSGDGQQCKGVIEAMLMMKSKSRLGGGLGFSSSMSTLWEALLAFHPGDPVACLFPMGVAVAPVLAMEHPLLLSCAPSGLAGWTMGLLSLYPKAVKPQSLAEHKTWPLAVAAPPWEGKTRELLVEDPWLPPSTLECPSAIRDSSARRVYAAHQRCTGTTYAMVSAGIGVRTSRDLEFFREELVRKNWLDAAVALPAGAMSETSAEALLLVLKHDRALGEPIQMVHAHDLVLSRKGKARRLEWDSTAIKELSQLLRMRRENAYSRLITAEELADNGYNLQPGRYLHSKADITLQSYIASRETVQLGNLADIRRPVASLSRQVDEGIQAREVTPADIDDSGRLRKGSKVIRLPEVALAKGRQHLLEPGDVLLSIKGGLGKVALVQDLEEPTVPGQAFCVVRLRGNAPISPAALVQYLRSAVGQAFLNKAGQGATVAFVPMGEVKSLPIVIPRASEVKRVDALEEESVALSSEVEELSRRLSDLSRRGWLEDLPPALISSSEEVLA